MKKILTLFSVVILCAGSHAFAQDKKQSDTPTTAKTEKPKNEVEQLIDKARERGEVVLSGCFDDFCENLINGGVVIGRALALPKPRYPAIAIAGHASGEVQVQLIIDVDGKVMAAVAISGHPLLYGVSVEAARNSRFSPTKLDGVPVKVAGVISYNFYSQ